MVREDTRELVDGQDVTQSLLRLVKLQVPELSLISIQVCMCVCMSASVALTVMALTYQGLYVLSVMLNNVTNILTGRNQHEFRVGKVWG